MKTFKKRLSQTLLTGTLIFTTAGSVDAQNSLNNDKQITISQQTQDAFSLSNLISLGINAALIAAALLTVIFLIVGGVQCLTAKGNTSGYENGRSRIISALIGLAVVAAAYAILTIIGTLFS